MTKIIKIFTFRMIFLSIVLCLSVTSLCAVDFIFGNANPSLDRLPVGCSGHGGTYACTGAIAICDGDTITIVSPSTITMSAAFATNANNKINVSGIPSNLNLIITGAFSLGANSTINANIICAGAVVLGADSNLSGSIVTGAGAISIGVRNMVIGPISTVDGAISVAANAQVTGNITTLAGAISAGAGIHIIGNIITSSGAVTLGTGSIVTGSIGTTVAGAITVAASTKVSVQIYSANNDVITLGAGSVVASVCCKKTSNAVCVVNGSTFPMPPTCTVVTFFPLAEYRFDECSWNGTAKEVKDSSGNGYSGTMKNKTMTLESGKICRGPSLFNNDSYIELLNFPNLTSNMTITTWFKTTDVTLAGQRIFEDDQNNNNGYGISVGDGGSGKIRFYDRSQSGSGIIDSDVLLHNNMWYFVAGIVDLVSAKRYLYLYDSNGNLINTKSLAMTNIFRGSDNGVATIGGEPNDGELNYRFKGSIDEVKVFSSALSQSQIKTIVNNEQMGKSYDGTVRTCNICTLPTCFTDTFDRTNLGSAWSIIKAENFTPNITFNKLLLTDKSAYVSSGVSLIGDLPSSNNLIEIEFEHNAYGGNGADGVVVVLSDANITPVAGASGGSLGYANRSGLNGFAGGWLGFGLDEFGNFSNPSEGRNDGPGFRADAFAIRGSGKNQIGYKYIAGTTTLNPGIDNASSSNPSPQYKYKLTIDTRNNQTIVSVGRDTNSSGIYFPLLTGANATQASITPERYKLSFTGSTGGSNNYHSFDTLSIKALQCGTLGQDINTTQNFFDAWDISGDIAHRAIQTKIVKQDFTLNIVGLNTDNTAYQDFNGTVCVRLIDSNDNNLTAWNKLLFTGANLQTTTFNSSYASRDSRVSLSWKKNVNTECPISVEDNNTQSTDPFAIRPKTFNISNATIAYAGDNFKLDFKAFNADGINCLYYNETNNGSFQIISIIDKNGCTNGDLNVSNFSFIDGLKSLVDANYSDVGDINITISEKSTPTNFEFAKIDASDTSDINRLITPMTYVVSVQPYELNITDTNYTASTGTSWLYDANVSDMNVTVNAVVQANNKQHIALKNFTSVCYAQSVDLKFYFNVDKTMVDDFNLSYSPTSLDTTLNKTITILASNFNAYSMGIAQYSFNIDRAYNKPLNPVDINLIAVKVISKSVAKNENNATVSKGERFYYGRIKTKDIMTDKIIVPHSLHIEVYATTPLAGFYQNSLFWYINANDDSITQLVDSSFNENKGFVNNQASTSVAVSTTSILDNGILTFNINNPAFEGSSTIHVNIPLWLWNSNLGDYNISDGSNCSLHPCFDYKYSNNTGVSSIKSGELKGSTIGSDYNTPYQKTGVKTFR